MATPLREICLYFCTRCSTVRISTIKLPRGQWAISLVCRPCGIVNTEHRPIVIDPRFDDQRFYTLDID